MADLTVCEKCDPNRYAKSCRGRWWRRAKCRYSDPVFFRTVGGESGLVAPIDGAVVERRANRAMKRLLEREAKR